MIFLSPNKYFPVGSHAMNQRCELATTAAQRDVIQRNFAIEAQRLIGNE